MSGYDLHPEAFTGIDEIAVYIGQDSPKVRDYLIAYAPDEKPLWVIAVMHGPPRDGRDFERARGIVPCVNAGRKFLTGFLRADAKCLPASSERRL